MRDLREFHDPHLHLPIAGKVYTVKAPTAEFGLKLKRHMADPEADPADEVHFIASMLNAEFDPETGNFHGGLWDEMNDDGVPYTEILHVGNTAISHYGVSPEFGELWWETKLGKEHLPLVPEAAAQWEKNKVSAQVAAKVAEMYPNTPKS